MNKKLISIIIPMYNAEKTIKNTIMNILNQTYQCFELLIINDCSVDQSLMIAESFNDKRIKIFSNEINKGAGYSRNIGLKNCKGELVCFIDSDDYVDENYLFNLYSSYIENQADLVVCDIEVVGKIRKRNSFKFITKKDLINNPLIASPCAKLIKKKLFTNSMFFEGIINEDVATIIPIVVKSDQITYCGKTTYQYLQNSDSVQNSKFSEKKFDIFKAVDIALERIKNDANFQEYKEMIIFNQIIMFYLYMVMEIRDNKERLKYLKIFKQKLKFNLLNNKYIDSYLRDKGKINERYYHMALTLLEKNQFILLNVLISGYRFAKMNIKRKSVIKDNLSIDDLISAAKKQNELINGKISVSVVIPNYNYENYLIERIYSVLNQDYKIHELIILDDCSSDDSVILLEEICDKISSNVNIKKEYNSQNSGYVFAQWEKGFELSSGEYVWIAEADDYSDKFFLKDLVDGIVKSKKDVSLAYCNTNYINAKGNIIFKKVINLIDIQKTSHWSSSYLNKGMDELMNYSYLNCTISNVSSVLFKKSDYNDTFNLAKTFKQVGDWFFYNNVMMKGYVLYLNKVHNFYRIHGENTTVNTKKRDYISEINRVYEWEDSILNLNSNQSEKINERLSYLKNEWKVEE